MQIDKISKINMNKFYCEQHIILSSYFMNDKICKILTVSDIHYHPNVDKGIFLMLIDYARKSSPDFIVIPGDLIETIEFINYSSHKLFFERFIKELSEIAPILFVPGNHDIADNDAKSFILKNFKTNLQALRYFDSLNKLANVYFLVNEQVRLNEMNFLGFSPRIETYRKKGDLKTNEMFAEDYLKSGLKMTSDGYNVLITHSPILLTEPFILNNICDFQKLTDLAITGHLHDAYLPKVLDRYVKNTNAGLFFAPYVSPFSGMICRGIHEYGRGYLFVSQGFRKWTTDTVFFNFIERYMANDVEELFIKSVELTHENDLARKRVKKDD